MERRDDPPAATRPSTAPGRAPEDRRGPPPRGGERRRDRSGAAQFAPLSRKSFVGVYELVAFALCLLALALFRVIGRMIELDSRLARLDVAVEAAVHHHLPDSLRRFAGAVTWAGNGPTVVVLMISTAVVLLAARRYVWLVGWVGAVAGASALAVQLKRHYARPRPLAAYALRSDWSYSYPSAHALGAVVTYGMLAYMLVQLTPDPRRRVAVVAATTVLVLLVGASRVLLRVHFLSDVLGGLLLGGAWLVLCVLGLELARRREWVTAAERDEARHTPG